MKAGLKPRYDGHCRDGAEPVAGVKPVVRFRNPREGDVVFDDLVRGRISISNTELDDLVIARPDGSPTYNFTVVVDDMDMEVTPGHSWRRSHQQHAPPDQHLPGAGCRTAGFCPRADDPG